MKAISLWQPWAWAILHAGKDVENRVWRTHHRGPLLLHAAKRRPTLNECESFIDMADDIFGTRTLFKLLTKEPSSQGLTRAVDALRALPRGGIVGRVEVVDCVKGYKSPWAFEDQFQWVVQNPAVLPFKPYKGERGFFEVDYEGLEVPEPPPKKQLDLL